jgi:hypothetical protein
MKTNLEKINKAHDAMVAALANTKEALENLDVSRLKISIDSYSGNEQAKKRFDQMGKERLTLLDDIANIQQSLKLIGRQREEYEKAEQHELTKEQARKVRLLAEAALPRGAKIAQACETLRDEIVGLGKDLQSLRNAGADVASQRLVALAMTRSVQPLLREAGLDFGPVAPYLRHDIKELGENYVRDAIRWADRVENKVDNATKAESSNGEAA